MIIVRSLVFQGMFLLWTLALSLLYLPLLAAPRRMLVSAARFWLAGTLFLVRVVAGLSWELRGRENLPPGGVLVAAKHQSAFDTLIFHMLLDDPAFILKKELLRLPFIGWYLTRHRMIAIDRKAGIRALKQMVAEAKVAAAEGRQVVIFPEGTRTAPGDTAPYHSGVAMLNEALGVPVVPVALNSGLFWARQSILRRPGRVVVEILPLMPSGLDRRAFLAELQARIEAATNRLVAEGRAEFPHVAGRHTEAACG